MEGLEEEELVGLMGFGLGGVEGGRWEVEGGERWEVGGGRGGEEGEEEEEEEGRKSPGLHDIGKEGPGGRVC